MKRIEWVDIIKGIGSVMVVVSHAYKGFDHYYLLKTIYLFCMPLYFFVSGFMYKKRENIGEHIKNKCYQLFVPYFSLLILFLPICLFVFPREANLIYYDSFSIDMLRYFFFKSNLNPITGSLWFLPCLFLTQVGYNIMRNKLNDNQMNITIFIMLLLSYVNYIYFQRDFTFPLYINLILASIPIYHIGYLYKKHEVKDNLYLMLILLCMAIWGIKDVYGNVYNIADAYYGIPFFTLVSSIILTIWIKNISIGIDKYNIFPKFFINLGKASIVIMAFHLTFVVIFDRIGVFILDNVYNSDLVRIEIIPLVSSILSTLIPLGIYFLIKRFTITRAFFMGRKDDARLLKQKLISLVTK